MKNSNFLAPKRKIFEVPEKLLGLSYLLLIAFIAALSAGVFELDHRVLMVPAEFILVFVALAIGLKKVLQLRKKTMQEAI